MVWQILHWIAYFLTFMLEAGLIVFVLLSVRKGRKLRNRNRALRQQREAIFDFVHNIGEVFAEAEALNIEALLNRILFFATRTVKAGAGTIYVFNSDRTRLYARAVSGIFPPLYDVGDLTSEQFLANSQLLENQVKNRAIEPGEGLIGSVAAVGSGMIIEDAEIDARVPAYTDPFLKIESMLIVPMRFGNEVLGVITLINRTDGVPFTAGDLNLLQAMADQASVPVHYAGLKKALEQKRQIDRDMRVARQIQGSLLPQELPTLDNVKLSAFNMPAYDIGGDYYDVIRIGDDHIGLAIADVSGKGIGGAMMMSVCQGVLRSRAAQEQTPARMLSELNRVLSANLAEDMFITMLYMVLNLKTRELRYARAGHEPPLLKRTGTGGSIALHSKGIAIGLADNEIFDAAIEDGATHLEHGDTIVAYTDGITEALNTENEEWGTDALLKTIDEKSSGGLKELTAAIQQRILRHAGAQPQYDDMTLLAMQIR